MVLRIAHVDDDSDIRESVQLILKKDGYEVDSYLTMQDFFDSLKNNIAIVSHIIVTNLQQLPDIPF